MSTSNRLLTAALAYARKGFAVIPLHSVADGVCTCGCSNPACNSRGKHPRIGNWVEAASKVESMIRDWWKKWPDANVGIATGAISGILVLDIDPRHGGQESLGALQMKNGPLPQTLEVRTGGGGAHLYFRHPGGRIGNSSGMLGLGLDVRADGGYVVAPPSIHATGDRYRWKR